MSDLNSIHVALAVPEGRLWGSPVEHEVRRRIGVSVAAYAYEVANTPIMPDSFFDIAAARINPEQGTCHPLLDEFFRTKFSPMTGMWIHEHPELDGIARIYRRYYSTMRDYFSRINWDRINNR